MTATETHALTSGLKALGLSYRGRALEAEHVEACLTALEGYDVDWLLAGLRAAPAMYPRFFPSVGEILKAAEQADTQSTKQTWVTPAMAEAIQQGERHCTLCDDTGFVYLLDGREVDLTTAVQKGARKVTPCRCRPTNPIYKAKRARVTRIGSSHERQGY
jgi:hypothetical protein